MNLPLLKHKIPVIAPYCILSISCFFLSCQNQNEKQVSSNNVNEKKEVTNSNYQESLKIDSKKYFGELREGTYRDFNNADTSIHLILRLKKINDLKYYYSIDCFTSEGYMTWNNDYPINSGVIQIDNLNKNYRFLSIGDTRLDSIEMEKTSKNNIELFFRTKNLGQKKMNFAFRRKEMFDIFDNDVYHTIICFSNLEGKENVELNCYEFPDEESKFKKIIFKNSELIIRAANVYSYDSKLCTYSLIYLNRKPNATPQWGYDDWNDHLWIKFSDLKSFKEKK